MLKPILGIAYWAPYQDRIGGIDPDDAYRCQAKLRFLGMWMVRGV